MSHFSTIQTQVKDLAALAAAVAELGLALEIAKPGLKKNARGYDDLRACDAVIKCKGPYDVACERQPDGTYALVTDWWDGHAAKEVGKDFSRVLQGYAVCKTEREMKRLGNHTRREITKSGAVNVVVSSNRW